MKPMHVLMLLSVAGGCAGAPRAERAGLAREPEWVGCDEASADAVLVVDFNVCSVGQTIRQEVPIRQMAGQGGVSGSEIDLDGVSPDRKRLASLGTSLLVRDDATPGVTFDASVYWVADNGRAGDGGRTVTALRDRTSRFRLSNTANMTVSFRKPNSDQSH